MHSRVFPCPYHLSQERHSLFLRPGHYLSFSLYPKRQRRWSASMLLWVKFFYTVSHCRATRWSSAALWRGVTDEHPLFQKKRFSRPLRLGSTLQTLWSSLCHFSFSSEISSAGVAPLPYVLASSYTRQSRPLPFFPSGCTLSKAKTIACCPCHLVRVTSTLVVGKVAETAKRWLPVLSCCLATHCGYLPKASALLIVLSCCLARALSAPRFPSFRTDTASFRSCLLMPLGLLDTREAGICAGVSLTTDRLLLQVWTRQKKSSNSVRILWIFNAPNAIPYGNRSPTTFQKDNCDFNSIPGLHR